MGLQWRGTLGGGIRAGQATFSCSSPGIKKVRYMYIHVLASTCGTRLPQDLIPSPTALIETIFRPFPVF